MSPIAASTLMATVAFTPVIVIKRLLGEALVQLRELGPKPIQFTGMA
ncbi:hypothetical protein [Microvirga lotononidis]|nr:hypothetical protein [Microvirga lotononidis]WQO31531.1 hypothetical protein U0023_29580 [Microvirga lotononidis]